MARVSYKVLLRVCIVFWCPVAGDTAVYAVLSNSKKQGDSKSFLEESERFVRNSSFSRPCTAGEGLCKVRVSESLEFHGLGSQISSSRPLVRPYLLDKG